MVRVWPHVATVAAKLRVMAGQHQPIRIPSAIEKVRQSRQRSGRFGLPCQGSHKVTRCRRKHKRRLRLFRESPTGGPGCGPVEHDVKSGQQFNITVYLMQAVA